GAGQGRSGFDTREACRARWEPGRTERNALAEEGRAEAIAVVMLAGRGRRRLPMAGQGGTRSRVGNLPVRSWRERQGISPRAPTWRGLAGQVEHVVVVIVFLARGRV